MPASDPQHGVPGSVPPPSLPGPFAAGSVPPPSATQPVLPGAHEPPSGDSNWTTTLHALVTRIVLSSKKGRPLRFITVLRESWLSQRGGEVPAHRRIFS